MELNFSPSPVKVTTPTMMPAPADVAATFRTPMVPPSSAFTRPEVHSLGRMGPRPRNTSHGISEHSGRSKLVKADTTVAQKTDSTGEKPHIMKKTMEISDRKWNQ